MAFLTIINGTSPGSTIQLRPGAQRVGRREENDVCLLHASISGAHCEVSLDASGALVVRDLGSTNGTFVEGQRVQEAMVQPGQRLRLGDLEMLFQGDSLAPTAAPPVPAAPEIVAGPNDCARHPGVLAGFVCTRCGRKSCKDCTKQQKAGMSIIHFCPACNGRCKTVGEASRESSAMAERSQSFGAAIAGAFKYPFKGNGLILLITGTIFYSIVDWILGAAFGLLTLVVFVLVYGYLLAYLQKIVVTSAAGESDPPEWPDVSDIGSDVVQPFFQFLVTWLVSFGPAIYVTIAMGPLPGTLVSLLGAAYFPMALLAVAMSDSYSGLNPIFVLSSIMKVFGHYLATCVAFWILSFAWTDVKELLEVIKIPLLPHVVFWFFFLIGLMICTRILGKLYFLNRNKLGWGL